MLAIRQYQPSDYNAVRELHYLGLRQFGALADEGPLDEDLEDIPNHYINPTSPVIATKYLFLEAKVSTTIGKFSCTGADVN